MPIQNRDTGTDDLLARLDAGVLTLTMNRPEARNALTPAMVQALADQLGEAELDDAVRCVVLTGAGKGFCSGGDVKAMADGAPETAPALHAAIHRQRVAQRDTAGRLFKMPKPTIAVVNGSAAGAGLALALSCDLRLMSTTAALLTAFVKVALPGDFGAAYFLTRLAGPSKARQLMLMSERVDAEEALRLGLTNWICDPQDIASRTDALAAGFAAGPGVAYRYMKENLNRAISGEIDDCLDVEAAHHVHCFATADTREAVSAFVDKREPVFTGR